jgi:ATP-dependent Lon protease
VRSFVDNPKFFQVRAEVLPEVDTDPREIEALARATVGQFEQYVKLNKKVPPEVLVTISQIEEPGKLADSVAAHLSLKIATSRSCSRPTPWPSGWRSSTA